MPPDTFEKFLPFAMALGVEHHWAQAFAGSCKTLLLVCVAKWRHGFNPIFFSSSMHSMATDMHQVFVSAPRSSSSGSGWSGAVAVIFRWRIRRRWRQRVLALPRSATIYTDHSDQKKLRSVQSVAHFTPFQTPAIATGYRAPLQHHRRIGFEAAQHLAKRGYRIIGSYSRSE